MLGFAGRERIYLEGLTLMEWGAYHALTFGYFSQKKWVWRSQISWLFLIHYELSENQKKIFWFFTVILGDLEGAGTMCPPPYTQATSRSPTLLGLTNLTKSKNVTECFKNCPYHYKVKACLAISNPSWENLKIRLVVDRLASSDFTLGISNILELWRSNPLPLSPEEIQSFKKYNLFSHG